LKLLLRLRAMSTGQLGAGTVFDVKCLFAIDAIADVYVGDDPIDRVTCASLTTQPIQAAYAGFGCCPNQVFRIASRTSEPTAGE
jgi:hypothetical protein